MPKIDINGVTREMTSEEIAEFERVQAEMQPHNPTPEERLAKIEEENAHLKEALNLLLTGVVE